MSPFVPSPGHTDIPHEGDVATEEGMVHLVDLPGIYSIAASSEDEVIARDYLLSGEADLVLNIVDATNLERNLYLTLQLLEMRIPVLVVLNMSDLAQKRGIEIDADHLSEHLGVPVVAVSAISREGLRAAKEALAGALIDFFDILFGAVFVVRYAPSRLYRCNALHSRSIGEVNAEAIWAERY